MSPSDAAWAIGIGLASGILSGLFGVGGGIVMTPGIDILLPVPQIAALETPLPVIFPTALVGAFAYRKAGQVDVRAASWMAPAGIVGSAAGALLTHVIDVRALLLATAVLLGYQSISILRGGERRERGHAKPTSATAFLEIGLVAGLASGLLGIGGGVVIVPLLAGWLGIPLKRALGTSLLTIPALVIPGTIVHAYLGDIDWWLFVLLTIGAVPGVWIGARIALGTAERTLRTAVGSFMLLLAAIYGVSQAVAIVRGS